MRGLLLFVLGALVGANATYFLMSRHSMGTAPVATGSGERTPVNPASPATGSSMAIEAGDTHSNRHDSGPILPPPVARVRGVTAKPVTPSTTPTSQLLIPVQGIAASQLSDTFTDSRNAGRSHDAIDIMAPAGTPVLAVADGRVEKLFTSKLGGLTLYEFNRDGTLAYYYAHLQRYAEGLPEQQAITRGQVIGYVGSTGNANPDAPHLHFAIFVLGPEKQWWKGEPVNPYPRLMQTGSTPD